jgi:hypothetical protein
MEANFQSHTLYFARQHSYLTKRPIFMQVRKNNHRLTTLALPLAVA